MTGSPFDAPSLLRVLGLHGVRYVLIGGLAGRAHGSPSVTNDTDICYDRADVNLERLAGALRAMHARLRGVSESVPFKMDWRSLKAGDHFTFTTDFGPFDCLGTPSGASGFDQLMANAERVDLDGTVVNICSLEDLMRMKRAAGRPKDRVELEILTALREEIEKRGEQEQTAG